MSPADRTTPTPTSEGVQKAAAAIRVIHEEITEPYEAALQQLQQAAMICFLGFGYNRLNVERLRIPDWPLVPIYGTAFGITAAERTRIEHEVIQRGGLTFGTDAQDVLTFLRHHALLP